MFPNISSRTLGRFRYSIRKKGGKGPITFSDDDDESEEEADASGPGSEGGKKRSKRQSGWVQISSFFPFVFYRIVHFLLYLEVFCRALLARGNGRDRELF